MTFVLQGSRTFVVVVSGSPQLENLSPGVPDDQQLCQRMVEALVHTIFCSFWQEVAFLLLVKTFHVSDLKDLIRGRKMESAIATL